MANQNIAFYLSNLDTRAMAISDSPAILPGPVCRKPSQVHAHCTHAHITQFHEQSFIFSNTIFCLPVSFFGQYAFLTLGTKSSHNKRSRPYTDLNPSEGGPEVAQQGRSICLTSSYTKSTDYRTFMPLHIFKKKNPNWSA